MPAIANLALQNNAAAAVTATAIVPSSGDTSPARWRIENTDPPFARTEIQMQSRFNTKRTARHVDIKISAPYTATDANTAQKVLVATALFQGTLILPTNIPTSFSDDVVAYLKTCLADATVLASLKAGYAPT